MSLSLAPTLQHVISFDVTTVYMYYYLLYMVIRMSASDIISTHIDVVNIIMHIDSS